MKRSLFVLTLIGALAGSVHAQIISSFGGVRSAFEYAYGWPGVPSPALNVAPLGGNATTGSSTITLVTGTVSASNIASFNPLSTTTPIYVGFGANQELVTPTAVSGCGAGQPQNSCQVTASFTKLHGPSEPVFSGTFGLQEAINAAHSGGGGIVAITSGWSGLGGTNSTITSATPWSNVYIQDARQGYSTAGTFSGAPIYWSMQPTTLTSLAAPTTLSASTVVFSASPVGTWANSAYYFCVTYVDALGGEGPCSATYNQTPTANYTATITAPAASTGAVGWRFYAGASYNAAYLMPITSSNCTLTTLENVMPACAIGSNGVWTAPPLTTTTLRPNAQSPTVNLNLPMPQGHTTFGYAPSGSAPQSFQTHYGPFPQFGALTAAQKSVVASINFPTGFLNYIGRTVTIHGKLTLGTVNTATLPTLNASLGWVGGTTAGAPSQVCLFEGVAVGATKDYNADFSCTITTNASGATAIGTLMPAGYITLQAQDLSANGISYIDSNTSAVGSLGLFAQDTVYITYTSTTNATGTEQVQSMDVNVLQ